ncbi:hypothetical protein [Marinobacter lipolyticus]|uniref:hypothetical protein n=1 Tax=Marinobacter lipolyticus TaxID=209639 RepID=UPI003A932AC0
MDEVGVLLIYSAMYGWPILVGLMSLTLARADKTRAGLISFLIAIVCLAVAMFLSAVIANGLEFWVLPVANSQACLTGEATCPIWLLDIAEIIEDWYFFALEVLAVSCSILFTVRQPRKFNQ